MTMLDGNSVAESNYQFNQSQVDKDWELSKPEKCDAVVEYACKIMSGTVSKQEFIWCFSDFYLDSDFDGEVYVDGFQDALDIWNLGESFTTQESSDMIRSIIKVSLDSASHILYDVELDELSTWSQGEDNLERMINEVLKG